MPFSARVPAARRPDQSHVRLQRRGTGRRLAGRSFGLAGSALVTLLVGCAQQDAGAGSSLPTFTATPALPSGTGSPPAPGPPSGSATSAVSSGPTASSSPVAVSPGGAPPGQSATVEAAGSSSAAPIEVPVAAASAWAALPVETSGPQAGLHDGFVLIGKPGRTAEERAAVNAVKAYWDLLFGAYRKAVVNRSELAKVMLPEPSASIEKYVGGLHARQAHTVGWTVVDVRLIGVTPAGHATGAAVSGCGVDATVDVDDATGRSLQAPVGEFTMDAGLHLVGSRWLVSSMRLTAGACTVPG